MNKNRYIYRMNTVKEIREGIVRSLTPHVGKDEAEAMARIILEDAAGVSRTAAIIDPGRLLEDATVARISAIVGRVADGEPLQYVLSIGSSTGNASTSGRPIVAAISSSLCCGRCIASKVRWKVLSITGFVSAMVPSKSRITIFFILLGFMFCNEFCCSALFIG